MSMSFLPVGKITERYRKDQAPHRTHRQRPITGVPLHRLYADSDQRNAADHAGLHGDSVHIGVLGELR